MLRDTSPHRSSLTLVIAHKRSKKFADMMEAAITDYARTHGLSFDSITKIPLEGEGSIETRVEKCALDSII